MNRSLQKLVSGLVTLTTTVVLSLGGVAAPALAAGTTTSNYVNVVNPLFNGVSNYVIGFTPASTVDIQSVVFQFTTAPSGAPATPTGEDASSAGIASVTYNGSSNAAFAGASGGSLVTAAGSVSIDAGSAQTSAQNVPWIFTLSNITNVPTDGAGCDSVTDSESCYIRWTTYTGAPGSTIVDQGTASFTIVKAVTVTAVIDPFLTFAVTGVTSSVTAQSNDIGLVGNSATFITGTTSNSIPFGNMTPGTPKYAQQKLVAITNAGGGYTVSHKFTTTTTQGSGVVLMKNVADNRQINPFTKNTATYSSPQSWDHPSGTVTNVNTAWIGMRALSPTTTTDTAQFVVSSGSANWAPPAGNGQPANIVKHITGPDNGNTAQNAYVTFEIEANALQASDSYTGSMVYNVAATY